MVGAGKDTHFGVGTVFRVANTFVFVCFKYRSYQPIDCLLFGGVGLGVTRWGDGVGDISCRLGKSIVCLFASS